MLDVLTKGTDNGSRMERASEVRRFSVGKDHQTSAATLSPGRSGLSFDVSHLDHRAADYSFVERIQFDTLNHSAASSLGLKGPYAAKEKSMKSESRLFIPWKCKSAGADNPADRRQETMPTTFLSATIASV